MNVQADDYLYRWVEGWMYSRVGRLKKFLSAWVAFDAIFRADSENRIKKIIKNGLGGGESPLKIEF